MVKNELLDKRIPKIDDRFEKWWVLKIKDMATEEVKKYNGYKDWIKNAVREGWDAGNAQNR